MMVLDPIDKAILHAVAENGRLTQAELGSRIGLSQSSCARRQRLLEEAGYITGYHAALGLRSLGFRVTVLVRISLDSQIESALSTFEDAIARCPSIVRCYLMSGPGDYLLVVKARDIDDYEHIHKTQLSSLPRVARIESNFAMREVVSRHNPLSLFEAED